MARYSVKDRVAFAGMGSTGFVRDQHKGRPPSRLTKRLGLACAECPSLPPKVGLLGGAAQAIRRRIFRPDREIPDVLAVPPIEVRRQEISNKLHRKLQRQRRGRDHNRTTAI
jgi:hypothetical protein